MVNRLEACDLIRTLSILKLSAVGNVSALKDGLGLRQFRALSMACLRRRCPASRKN
jgi:hypothetical protein